MRTGLNLLIEPQMGAHPLIDFFQNIVGGKVAASIIVAAIALYVGFLKGKFVLRKTAAKGIARIQSLPNPAPLYAVYGWKYLMLLAGMILLGVSFSRFGLNTDIRGAIDLAVGSALISGALCYLRSGWELRKVTVS